MEYSILNWNANKKLEYEIWEVGKSIIDQIKKIRIEKGLSQADLAIDLGMTQHAYSKIERGKARLDIDKLVILTNSLDVNIVELFPGLNSSNKLEEDQKKYGYADKTDIDDLTALIKQLKNEISALRKDIALLKQGKSSKKK